MGIGGEDTPQVRFPQDHNVVQALSPDGADEPFNVCVLPWRFRCCWSIANTNGCKTSGYSMANEPSRPRMRYRGACSQGKASVIWRAIQSAVGLVVTLVQTR